MTKVLNPNQNAGGTRNSNDPQHIGDLLNDLLQSDEPLFRDIFPNTELSVDLKLLTREPGRMDVGAYLDGTITHDGEDHFTFIQNASEKKKVEVTQRNPHVYCGLRINVNRKDDGTLYPTFNRPRYTKDFTFQDFCREAAEELLAVAGLVEKMPMAE